MSNKERKRTRGEIACAECRRLKARCDKQIPCSTCIKRGCSMLCPNGTMPPGEGSRFVGIAEDYLRRKSAKMEERMRSLEDALAIIQGNITNEPHPLLQRRLSPDPLDPEEIPSSRGASDEYNKYGLIGALGQLHFEGDDQTGHSRFFGASGGSETLLLQAKELMIESGSESPPILREADLSYLPREILMFSQSFPFTPMGIPVGPVQTMIEAQLPSIERARALCHVYLTSMSWMAHIVSMQHMLGEIIPAFYKLAGPSDLREYGPHELALLLIVMAIGALCDPSLPPYNSEAQHYHCLARAAICLQSILGERSLTTVKALHLKSIYNGMSGMESNLEKCYGLLNLSGQTALQIGFHKDPERWGFRDREAYDRRAYFWNLLAGTLWQSLVTGRPPVIMPSVVDCRPPTAEEEMLYQQGEVPLGFGSWSFRYTTECLIPVVEATQAVKTPPYENIQDLDHRIRQFAIPAPHGVGNEQISEDMQNFARSHYRELTLMFLHRGFFAQAMTDYPSDPQRSPVAQSFIAAYQSACSVLASTITTFSQNPTLLARIWRPWSFAFSAAVIIGTVAIRALGVEPEPFEELEKACQLFRRASQHNCSRAHKALPVLLQLRQKALQAREVRQGPTIRRPEVYDESDDELAIFGGRTMLLTPSSRGPPAATGSGDTVAGSSMGRADPGIHVGVLGGHSETYEPYSRSTSAGGTSSLQSASHSHALRHGHEHLRLHGVESTSGLSQTPGQSSASYSMGGAAGVGLPLEWEGLYREIPGSGYESQASAGPSSSSRPSVLEDRWSMFLHERKGPS